MARSTLSNPTSTAGAEADQAALDALDALYAFRDGDWVGGRDEVRKILARHPELVPVLMEASERLPEFVPITRPVVLEWVPWEENDDADGTLFAVIQTDLPPEEVRPLRERLSREWLADAARRVDLRFNVGVDYF